MEYIDTRGENTRWKSRYDFISACGKARSPKTLAVEILENIGGLCSFDQALVYFFDGNGKICGQHLMGIDERWSSMYLGHYVNTDNQRYSCFVDAREGSLGAAQKCIDWDKEPSAEFVPDFIRPRGLTCSFGFGLFDLNGVHRAIISLDRVREKRFSADEIANLQAVIPQLNNLHKNYFYQNFSLDAIRQATWDTADLTAREAEIADLLCQGVSAANISRTLYIALSTTYKHIAHIYEKLNVSSQQEMLVRLLRPQNHSATQALGPSNTQF
jgi:DNA-binding CsgD family transcriptional regulator